MVGQKYHRSYLYWLRALRWVAPGLWLTVVVPGCSTPARSPIEPPGTELLGRRALVAAGGTHLPVFDAERSPRVRIAESATRSWRVVIVGAPGRIEPACRVESRGGATLVYTKIDSAHAVWNDAPQLADAQVQLVLDGVAVHRWPIRWGAPPEAMPALAPIVAARRAGDRDAARAALAGAAPTLDPWGRVWAGVERARLADDADAAVAAWRSAGDAAFAAGVPSEASRAWRAAAHHLLVTRRFAAAGPLIDRAEALDRRIGDRLGQIRGRYYRGFIATELGDFRLATHTLRGVADEAFGLGFDVDAAMANEMLATLLQDQGRHRDALAVFERIPTPKTARDRARSLVNHAWILLRGMRSGAFPLDLDRPQPMLEQAIALAPDPNFGANAHANLAGLEFWRGDLDAARAQLAAARRLDPEGRGHSRVFIELLEGEIALGDGDAARALAAFGRAGERALDETGGGDSDLVWRAHYGIGRARRAAGDAAGALDAFRVALATVERVARGTGLWHSRAPFFSDRRPLVDDAIDAMLARGDIEGAFAVADAARARVLRAVERPLRVARLDPADREAWAERLGRYLRDRTALDASRRDAELLAGPALRKWRLERAEARAAASRAFDETYGWLERRAGYRASAASGTQIAEALEPDAALLAVVRVGDVRHGFWIAAGRPIEHRVYPSAEPHDPVAPWADRLGALGHLYVSAGGDRAAQAIAQRTIGDRPLGAVLGVSFVPHAGYLLGPGPTASGPPVIVADPDVDLPQARAEGRAAADRWPGARLFIGASATRVDVLAALDGASLFHFAGHGVLEADVPWEAHLGLAGDDRIAIADILVSRARVGLVVLDGCETARQLALSPHERIGLPEAFIAAGAGAVLAADRPIADAAARWFIERFYVGDGARHPARGLTSATADAVDAGNDVWTAFRLVGRR